MRKFFHVIRMLSLDVVLGALASGSMVAAILGQHMPWTWWVGLPLGVWVCYTGDHLFDAYRLQSHSHTDRHLFHFHYFKPIVISWLSILIISICLFPITMPSSLLRLGIVLGVLSGLHLLMAHFLRKHISIWLQKEVGVASIYTIGIWGGPGVLFPELLTPIFYLLACQFFFLALVNLLLFSAFELPIDEMDEHTSWVRALGYIATIRISVILCIGILLSAVAIYIFYTDITEIIKMSQGITCIMTLVLISILLLPSYFVHHDRYRIWGDGIFLLPGIIGWMYWP